MRIAAPRYEREESGRIYIGRALWQQIGEPQQLKIGIAGAALVFQAPEVFEDGYTVHGIEHNTIPRINVGRSTLAQLGYPPGTYKARVDGPMIVVL